MRSDEVAFVNLLVVTMCLHRCTACVLVFRWASEMILDKSRSLSILASRDQQ